MNNLFITQGWFKRGAEVALKNYILLSKANSNSEILNLSNKLYNIDDIEENSLDFQLKNSPILFISLAIFFIKNRKKFNKIIFVNGKITLVSFLLTFVKFFYPKTQIIVWEHCIIKEHWNNKIFVKKIIIKISYYWLLFISNKIYVPSNIIFGQIKIFQKKIIIQHNPILINLNKNFIPVKEFKIENINILYVGSLSEEKNPLLFIEIIKKLSNNVPNIQGHIFGNGPLEKDVIEKINLLRLNEKVFLHGWIDNIHDYINMADLLCVTSNFETFCNVIMESITLGCPVISSSWNGVKDIYGNKIMYIEEKPINDIYVKKRHSNMINKNIIILNKFNF